MSLLKTKAGLIALFLLALPSAAFTGAAVWLVGPPSWPGFGWIAWTVFVIAFGPALWRWASASIRRSFLLLFGAFAWTLCEHALRHGPRAWGAVELLLLGFSSLIYWFATLAMLALSSLLHRPNPTAGRTPADAALTEQRKPSDAPNW